MSLLQNSNAISGGGYNITDSLRFRASASAYLTRTPTTAGNRKTFTYSAWVKVGTIGTWKKMFSAYNAQTDAGYFDIGINNNNVLSIQGWSTAWRLSTQVFRDPSAWYHIVVAVDTTQATASDRIKAYVNGSQITAFSSSSNPTQNYDFIMNNTVAHYIGTDSASGYVGTSNFDGYQTEINFVDGQALDPSYFGETNDNGVWSPIEYTGTYGTNGFYLPMKETTQATGFNTVIYQGKGSELSVTGVGFSPDLVWTKGRNNTYNHLLYDSVRGATKYLQSSSTLAETTDSLSLTSFNADGFTIKQQDNTNVSSSTSGVAWCWDAGSSTVSNTDGTITSSVRANPTAGFSIVTYTGTGGSGTVGHGLGSAPEMIILRPRNQTNNWFVWHTSIGGADKFMTLNTTDAVTTSTTPWNNTLPTPSVFSVNAPSGTWTNLSSEPYIAYCFSEVSGFSKFGSYTGNGSTSGPTVTTGFRPAFVMIKRTDAADNWHICDNTRSPDGTFNDVLRANLTNAESANNTAFNITYNDTGFTLANTNSELNASGGTYIYMAFADTRDFQWNFDASGNKNNWTPNNINSNASSETTYDLMSDTPSLADEDTGNFCTLNPLNNSSGITLSEANLKLAVNPVATNYPVGSTFGLSSGKWYFEVTVPTVGGTFPFIGITPSTSNFIGATVAIASYTNVRWYGNGGVSANDTIGIAFDLDNLTFKAYRNNVEQTVASTYKSSDTIPAGITWSPSFSGVNGTVMNVNFGQRPFKYTPPTGYKKLNTYNLPDSSITDGSQYFDVSTWTGNGSTQDITLDFSPDLVWAKDRSAVAIHMLSNTISGPLKSLSSNDTTAEASNDAIRSFNSDGFTTGTWVNTSSNAFVGWSWRGSDSTAVSNTNGTITSTVSANTTSGFSVVTYTGTGANATVGHGLGVAPKMIIAKRRDSATDSNWQVWHTSLTSASHFLQLNTTAAQTNANSPWSTGTVNSTIFTVEGANATNNLARSSATYAAYCFAEIAGFSKFGSYTGNGSTDGPFIYTGFRPAFIMFKRTNDVSDWNILDTTRSPYNTSITRLFANVSNAENSSAGNYDIDILSNGFKQRNTNTSTTSNSNINNSTYIYMAFASHPLKHSLAR